MVCIHSTLEPDVCCRGFLVCGREKKEHFLELKYKQAGTFVYPGKGGPKESAGAGQQGQAALTQ